MAEQTGTGWTGLSLNLVLFVLLVCVGGCGPISATQNISRASDVVAMAEAAYGDQYATYQFVSAQEYLEKAREEWGYSDYQQATRYARRALEQAQAALRRVQNRLDAFGNPLPDGPRPPNSPAAPQ